MQQYVAFLRGINLGPVNKISMPALREVAEGLGWSEVSTYINSGNLIFRAAVSAAETETALAAALEQRFGKKIDVTVRTPERLRAILADNPYPDGDPSQVTIAFLTAAPPADAEARIGAYAVAEEPFTLADREIYVHYGRGLGRSKLAERFSAIVEVSSTVRNINTVSKVLARCAAAG